MIIAYQLVNERVAAKRVKKPGAPAANRTGPFRCRVEDPQGGEVVAAAADEGPETSLVGGDRRQPLPPCTSRFRGADISTGSPQR